jgi:hypothetical protein
MLQSSLRVAQSFRFLPQVTLCMRLLSGAISVLLVSFLTGCGEPTPKRSNDSSGEDGGNHEEISGRIMFEHGVDRASLVKALRSLLKEAMGYVGKICVRLKSKCPETIVHKQLSPKEGDGVSEGPESGSQSDNRGKETSSVDSEQPSDHKEAESEHSAEDDENESEESASSESEASSESGDDATISTSMSAGSAEDEKPAQGKEAAKDGNHAEDDANKEQEEEGLSEEANKLLDIVFELGQTYPSLIPHLKDASNLIAQDYPKEHGSETTENVEIYIPLQLLRMYFDLIIRMHSQTEPLKPEILHVYSVDSFEILRSVMVSLTKNEGHVPHEIQALTKASELIKPLTLDAEDTHNTARRIVVKIFLAIADMFVLSRGLANGHKVASALTKLYETCVMHLELIPESLSTQLKHLNDVKNKLWLHRSDLFKNGRIDDSVIQSIQDEIVAIAGGERSADSDAGQSLDDTASADTHRKSSEGDQEGGPDDDNDSSGSDGGQGEEELDDGEGSD